MADIAVEVVAVEQRFWSGRATLIAAQTTEGEIGVMAGHEPMLGQLVDSGIISIRTVDGEHLVAAIHGGFLSVTAGKVTVLAESARWASDVDVAAAEAALGGSDPKAVESARGELRAAARAKG